ncbi:MAG: thiolase family protein [Candidatus Binatus sp.]|uniref:thiolase family protein n=1 Tax=Candidatus Binatus sp. TaxID=2811406 RepID=UPI00271FA0EB|nr:thiolase family protein [Candidatus Binatus sp.]MDO8432575.1 thiolase family protein [Candidatus Binatus sp.]
MELRAKCAIAGLGQTRMGKNFDHPGPVGFAAEAVNLALEDAGLKRTDLDGLLVNPGLTWGDNAMASFSLQQAMGLSNLRLTATMNLGGATAAAMIMHAAQSIAAGMAEVVAGVFSDAPLRPPAPDKAQGAGSAAAYGFARGVNAAYGLFGVNAHYAFVAQRHMHLYGTTNDHLGAIAVAERQWANLNPDAQFCDTPMSMADYHASRWVVEPFHLYDCCLVSNGGLAVIVTSAERAKDLKRPPVYVLGMGQGHPGGDPMETLVSGAPIAKKTAFKMANISLNDVDFCELYDCYTFTVLVTLEDYGYCKKGEGGAFVADGKIGPNGTLPVNTGGGQLSSFYMWGMTPVSEAIVQIRGDGGRRQVPKHEVGLVSGNGGILSTHSTLVLGSHA